MEIGDMSELRVLDLNGCSELKVIPPGVIKRLSRLEELHMAKSFSEWEVEAGENCSLDELNCLVNLTTLRIHIPDAKLVPKDFHFEKLERFTILIGDVKWDWSCHKSDEKNLYRYRGLKIKVSGSRNIHLEAGVQEMLKRTEILYLDGMKNIHELEWKSFQELKFVHIRYSAETRYIVNAMESFPAGLESLFLSHLPQLQSLCRAKSSFSKLKYVGVNNCNNLRNLFSFPMARALSHLEEVKVTNCNALEAIVEDTREDENNGDTMMDKLEFRQLRSLTLERLPRLAIFCNNVANSSIYPKRQKILARDDMESEDDCVIVAPFFNEKVLFPKLEELTLEECDSVEYLFNQSIVRGLEQLNFIEIENCKSLKGVVAQVEGEETNETIKFPQLVHLYLVKLPCLTRFCSGCSIVFPTLTRLDISYCPQLKTLVREDTVWEDETMTNKKFSTARQPLVNEKVELPNLKSLELWELDSVETIWHDRLHEDSFFKLERVDVRDCPKLLRIFPSTMLTRIRCLEELLLRDNRLVEEVFENEVMKPNILQGGETTENKIKFSQLRCLQLMNMSKLKRFCSGSSVVFPVLTQLEISGCEQIETFIYPIAVTNSKRKGVEDMDSNDMQPLFNDKVEFPILKKLKLVKLDNIKIIWESQRIHEDSFSTLQQLAIHNCTNLLRIFPLAIVGRIQSSGWKSTINKTVASESEDGAEDEIVFSKLKTLKLRRLPLLENFYLGNCILKFPSLEKVVVTWCKNMKAFCERSTVTPKLKTVALTWDKIDFVGDEEDKDLNTIIKVAEMNDKATEFSGEAESYWNAAQSREDDGICEKIFEPRKEVHTYDKETEPNDNEATDGEGVDLRKEGELCEEIVEPSEEIDTCKEMARGRNEVETILRPYLAGSLALYAHSLEKLTITIKQNLAGSLAPTPHTVDVTCPSSQSHPSLGSAVGATTCPQNSNFQGLQVMQHLVPLLEKARDKHGDFYNSPLIKSKTVRIAAMESVGQVLHVLKTQPPRSMDAEKIQFMEEAFHDVSNMSFPVEWLRPLIDKASKCLRRKEKIEEMEAQVQAFKREIEKVLVDLDQPLLDF